MALSEVTRRSILHCCPAVAGRATPERVIALPWIHPAPGVRRRLDPPRQLRGVPEPEPTTGRQMSVTFNCRRAFTRAV